MVFQAVVAERTCGGQTQASNVVIPADKFLARGIDHAGNIKPVVRSGGTERELLGLVRADTTVRPTAVEDIKVDVNGLLGLGSFPHCSVFSVLCCLICNPGTPFLKRIVLIRLHIGSRRSIGILADSHLIIFRIISTQNRAMFTGFIGHGNRGNVDRRISNRYLFKRTG